MIKATAGNTVIVGLSAMNVERLKEGKPIFFDGAVVGLLGKKVLIMYGETEQAIKAELETNGVPAAYAAEPSGARPQVDADEIKKALDATYDPEYDSYVVRDKNIDNLVTYLNK